MLTKRLHQTLVFIVTFQAEKGFSPTLAEIGEGVGLASTGGVHRVLSLLQERGHIWREKNCDRQIVVLKRPPTKRVVFIPVEDGLAHPDRAVEIPWPQRLTKGT